ncbi:hypothetical protein ig2599ANME_1175 [groundwater metagenome]
MPMDENAMFKALLKNKPQPKQPVTKEIKEAPAPAPKPQVRVEPVQPAPQAPRVQQEPVVITQVSPPPVVNLEPVVESINELSGSVNQIHGLMKTTVLPVMILILIVGIGILIKIQ